MKKKGIFGIEKLLKEKKKPELKDIVKIYDQLMSGYPMPSIIIDNHGKCKPGSMVTIHIKGLPLPGVDVFKGKIIKSERSALDLPLYASFRTTTGTTLRPLKQIKGDKYTAILPEKVTNGLVGIIFPIQETFGSNKIIDKFPADIQNWIKRSKHVSRSNLKKDDCPSFLPQMQDYRYLATIAPQPLLFTFSPNCSICPHGALKIAATYCYIDPLLCRGQKYSRLNGGQRGPEEACWDCFNSSDGVVSTRCQYVTIRKVLHLNPDAPKKEVPCCGGCEVPDLCHKGAIYKPPEYPHFYAADKKRCNGCMDCYLNMTCPWNCGTNCRSECEYYDRDSTYPIYNGEGGYDYVDVHNNYTMRMVAHIDEKLKLVLVKIEAIYRIEDYIPWEKPYGAHIDSKNMGSDSKETDLTNFDLVVWGDKQVKIPIRLDKTGKQDFKLKEIPFTKSMHLGLFEKSGNLLGFTCCGSNMPIKSLGGKRYSDPTKLVDGGIFIFNSPKGRIHIEYMIK